MIVKVIGTPSVTPMRFKLFADDLRLPYQMLSNPIPPSRKLTITRKDGPSFLTDVKLMYCASTDIYSRMSVKVAEAKTPYLVLVCDNAVVLHENGIYMLNTFQLMPGVFTTIGVSRHDILTALLATHNLYHRSIPFDTPFQVKPQHTTAYKILTDIIEAGSLHLIQPLFYVIKDKDERKRVQDSVYLYLSGTQSRIGRAGEWSGIVEKLASDKIQRLRSACIFAKTRGIDAAVERFTVDRFEVNYVLSKAELLASEGTVA